jgi:hypothetical protein
MEVVRWLAERRDAGEPGCLDTTVSGAVRVCAAAEQSGACITGTFFRVGGEPFTPAKAAILASAGADCAVGYSMSEVGMITVPCPHSPFPDGGHLLEDKLAAIRRPVVLGRQAVEALFFSTLAPECPKLMLNVESGDQASIGEMDCGCRFAGLGYRMHVHGIASYEKLCTEGMCFLGADLRHLIEEVLPAECGGHPGDYQLVEEEEGGLTKASIVASPSLGPLDEADIINRSLEVLRQAPGGEVMTRLWMGAGCLRVVRREPSCTAAGKI